MELGLQVRCRYTGFEGLVIGKATYLSRTTQLLVQPRSLDSNGNPIDSLWLEEGRLEVYGSRQSEFGFEPEK